jgi:hypothetical protein
VTVAALLEAALAKETDQVLDYRLIKALGKLRAKHPELAFPPELVERLIVREVETARRYATAWAAAGTDGDGPNVRLLHRALGESWRERRETTFRTLGLLHSPDGMHRCFMALMSSDSRSRANALEWLETTLGHTLFTRVEFLTLDDGRARGAVGRGTTFDECIRPLAADEDAWIAHCAAAALSEPTTAGTPGTRNDMDLIERVFLLQKVDLLRDARSAHLAMLAAIAEEVDISKGETLMREGEPADALYVVVRGSVTLRGVGGTLVLSDGSAFGTWALIDDAPSVVESGRVLRITRESFHDLIVDHPELALGLLQGLAHRVRTLVA